MPPNLRKQTGNVFLKEIMCSLLRDKMNLVRKTNVQRVLKHSTKESERPERKETHHLRYIRVKMVGWRAAFWYIKPQLRG